MPTDTERREVARRLRDIDIDDFSCYAQEYEALCKATGLGDYDTDWTNRLADLIEPSCDREALLALAGELEEDACGEWEPKAQDTTTDRTTDKTKSDEISLSASQPSGFYRFPEITHPSAKNLCRTPFEQAQKVIEEAVELFEEAKAGDTRRREMGVECMDAIHACETLLRRNFSDEEVAGLREACEAKNRARGFYG